ncbi:MAG: phytoene desaturase [Sphingomonadales bacterium]|nr:phytoene desaturase [Sphingomonadales bacterium]
MSKRAIVVGAGIAGIATSIRLARQGFSVEVFEASSQAGGKMSAFETAGYRFDGGPSLFTQPQLVDELFTLFGEAPKAHFKYRQLDTVCHYFYEDGTRFQAHKSWQDFSASLADIATDTEVKELREQLNNAAFRYNATAPLFIEQSLHKIKNYLNIKTLKGLFYVPKLNLFQSMDRENRRLVGNKYLVQYLNRFATYNGSDPYRAPALLNMIPHLEQHLGSFYPEGGMVSIPQSLYKLATRHGIVFHFNHVVQEIIAPKNQVEGVRVLNKPQQQTRTVPADVVVSNADVYTTYKHLLAKHPAPQRTLQQERSSSALVFYWGIAAEFPELHLHNILFSNDYGREFKALFAEGAPHDDPTIYINITTKCDNSDAPPGCENWFVMINVPSHVGQDWTAITAAARRNILAKLQRVLGRDIEPLIACETVLDPVMIEERTSSHGGSLYGTASNNVFSAFLRHKNFSSDIKGLYFCGGSVHPGGGIPLCLNSAKIVAQLVSEE